MLVGDARRKDCSFRGRGSFIYIVIKDNPSQHLTISPSISSSSQRRSGLDPVPADMAAKDCDSGLRCSVGMRLWNACPGLAVLPDLATANDRNVECLFRGLIMDARWMPYPLPE
jgi:hypothetical protein